MRHCVAIVVLVLVVAACGDSDTTQTTAPPAQTTTSTATTTTVPPAPTTAPATTATTAAPTTTAQATTTSAVGKTTTTAAKTTTTAAATTTTVDVNALASYSGCTPGPGALPNGMWFGYVEAAGADSIEFDLACWFSGEPAVIASAQDGEESPPPNDYYVRNVNPALRTIPIDPTATVAWLADPGGPDLTPIPYADWLAARVTRSYQPGIIIEVTGGSSVFFQEQYVP